jgi:hypothetical protein
MSAPKPLPHRDVFESRTETQVKFEFAEQEGDIGRSARAYLAEKQSEREESVASKRDAREEETLAIAKRALSIAEDANSISTHDLATAREQARWAKWAAILAAIAAITANKEAILALIFGTP